jgi:hypothetical protein
MARLQKLRTWLGSNITNGRGYKSNRKVLVIESDDWGSIRMPSKDTYLSLEKKGYKVNECPFNKYDSLEGNDDLVNLYEVLQKFKDKNGNPPIITFNNNVANPDFEKIEKNGFVQYYYEPFTVTLEKYPNRDQVYGLWKEGIHNKFIMPQFHGREHVHVVHWMQDLRKGVKYVHDAFEHKMFTITKGLNSSCRAEYLDAFGTYDEAQLSNLKESIEAGCNLFRALWGFESKSCIAPCYIWKTEAEEILKSNGIQYIQSFKGQLSPQFNSSIYTLYKRFTGMRNAENQIYLVRNVFFEPATDWEQDWVGNAMKQINHAFFWRTPAILSSHRLNYIGQIVPKNREIGLRNLESLLKAVVNRWPDVEFHSSDSLGDIIENFKNN